MEHLVAQIDQNTKRFTETFGALTAEQLNWKPDAKTWSIAQNIHHIILMNEAYFEKIEELKNGTGKTPFLSRFDFIVNFMSNAIEKYGQPDRKKRTKTFEIWKPANRDFSPSVLTDFEQHQNKFKRQIKQSSPLVKKGAVIPSPATRLLFFKLDKALSFIVSHEERHFIQAKEVFNQIMNRKEEK